MDDSDTVRQERLPVSDWHPPRVLAALKKRGHSLAGLSTAHCCHHDGGGQSANRSWPALKLSIAKAIGATP
jgi:lambda repressor-like predicted transcriptional regulator